MKRKIRKMSTVSRVKTYKKGNRWVSSIILTAGISALSLSGSSLIAEADPVVSHSQSTTECVASVSSTEMTSLNDATLKSSSKISSTQSAVSVSNSNSTTTSKNLEKKDKEELSATASLAHNNQINSQNKEITSKTTTNSDKSSVQNTANSTNTEVKENSTTINAAISDNLPAAIDNYHTPDYHIHNNQGWSNDVQTITQNADGTYNIYFLHSVDGAINPFGPNGQDWEHVTTRDWIHFTDEGIAVNSHGTSNPDSWKSAWTGSIIKNNGNILGVPKGAEVAYFSGLSKKDGSQNIWAAWSNDGGKTFVNALNDGAPVLSWNHLGASQQPDQERDADVIYWNGKLLMYTAEGNKLGVYQSLDGIHWDLAAPNKVSKILPETFFRGLNWQANNVPVECPQIRLMKGSDGQAKAVLFYGGKDPNGKPSQTTGTYYVVGHLDENGMFIADQNAARLDLGSDYYGSNINGNDNLNNPQNSLIGLGWVGNWSYTSSGVFNNQNDHQYPADRFQLENHLGAYSAPRILTLQKVGNQYRIVSKINLPVKTDTASQINVKDSTVVGNDSPYGNVYKIYDAQTPASQIFTIHVGTTDGKTFGGRIYIRVGQGKDAIIFNYDTGNGMMTVSQNAVELINDMNKDAANNYQKGTTGSGYIVNTGYKANGTPFDLTFFCDKTSIELQLPNGQIYTVARYAVNNNQDITIYAQDPNKDNVISIEKQSLQLLNNKPTNNGRPISDDDSSQRSPISDDYSLTSKSLTSDTAITTGHYKDNTALNSLTEKKNTLSLNSLKQSQIKSEKSNTVVDGLTDTKSGTTINSKSQASKDTLPHAGETSNKGAIVTGIMAILSALGFGLNLKRRD